MKDRKSQHQENYKSSYFDHTIIEQIESKDSYKNKGITHDLKLNEIENI